MIPTPKVLLPLGYYFLCMGYHICIVHYVSCRSASEDQSSAIHMLRMKDYLLRSINDRFSILPSSVGIVPEADVSAVPNVEMQLHIEQ